MPTVKKNPLETQEGGSHYKDMKIQPVEFVHANGLGFCEATAIKYLCRWRKKGGIQDLKKAIHFIEVLIELETRDTEGKQLADELEMKAYNDIKAKIASASGPYCYNCERLADFRVEVGIVSLSNCSLMGRL